MPTANKRRKVPRRLTRERLDKAALHYLERFASSEANLRRVLLRKVERAARAHPDTDRAEAERWIADLVSRFLAAGLLDDRRYAEMRAETLHRRGDSPRRIRAKLAQKGVASAAVDAALDALQEEVGDVPLTAAIALARRRRLGPFRAAEDRAARREKDLAALARAGFDYDTARRVIEAEDADALDALLAG